MISIHKINYEKLSELLANYNTVCSKLKEEPYYIDNIPEYSYYLSRLLKSIDTNSNNNDSELTKRIEYNSSFEEQLSNHGNNLENMLDDLNLKKILIRISQTIYHQNMKAEKVFNTIQEKRHWQLEDSIFNANVQQQNKILIISNSYDEVSLNEFICNKALKNIEISRYKKFIKRKEEELKDYYIIGYFLEGYRDFEVYHNLSVTVNLFLYDIEYDLYKDCINKYKSKLETELQSEDRFFISGINYDVPPPVPLSLSQTLQNIIDRTKNWNDKEFDDNIEDPDESSNDHILYQTDYEGLKDIDNLKSSDTVFDEHNNLIQANRLKVGDVIRVYKIDFGEILLTTAMEFQKEIFLEIDEHSNLWKKALKDIYFRKYNQDLDHLHSHLRNHGVKVLSTTVLNNWIYGKTKFPKSNRALKAIYELSKDIRLGASMGMILESKRIYNSTLISLGRDLKDEIKNFLIEGTIGEIMQKNNITPDTLRKVIDEQMPLKKIKNINTSIISVEDLDE